MPPAGCFAVGDARAGRVSESWQDAPSLVLQRLPNSGFSGRESLPSFVVVVHSLREHSRYGPDIRRYKPASAHDFPAEALTWRGVG